MDQKCFSILWRFIKNYNEGSDKGFFLEVDVQYLEHLHEHHNALPFLPERLVANLHDKSEYAIYIRNLKQALNYRLVFKKNLKSLIKMVG